MNGRGSTEQCSEPAARSEWPRPRLLISECLGFADVRYDGGRIPNSLVESLKPYVEFIPVCPEVTIGLGVPRPPIRLVETGEGLRLIQPDTGQDLTERMRRFSALFLSRLGEVDGAILKSRSPSCAPRDARVYPSHGSAPSSGQRPGLFAEAVRRFFPDIPVEDEGRLTNREIREHFLTAVFALARLRQAIEEGSPHALMAFHARYKFLLMAYNQEALRELGRTLANPDRLPMQEISRRYLAGFRAALLFPPRRPSMANALMHGFGYVSAHLTRPERAYFLELLADYREGRAHWDAPLRLLQSWAIRFEVPYLLQQALFEPFPRALISPEDSGKGRPLRWKGAFRRSPGLGASAPPG
ncbi:DUF523 and DUF1722 domain-containing protein [Thermoflexus sp.]|uniref:YbgA family protein n=1 Tax=Thermoflexus sp. TaxID=1969742 RepID=UPI002ADD4F44|nr:DUF523 and DUF1722 domain-containing protein [Thermoflexus sp.]